MPRHCTAGIAAALLALAAAAPAHAQPNPPADPATGDATYIVFVGGREVGREQAALSRSAAGWTITSTGRTAAPLLVTTNRFELTYARDWQPIELGFDGLIQGQTIGLSTSFATTTAINEITQNGVTNSKTDQISARTVVLPNGIFAAYEALAVRLAALGAGAELPVYIAPQTEVRLTVRSVDTATYQTPDGSLSARRYAVTFHNPNGPLDAQISVDERNRFARLEVAGGVLLVARQDLAGVATRQETYRNPTDTDVRIPAAGFSLAGTVTTPPAQGRLRHPAIVLLAGSGAPDRDATVAGIPIFGQLAGQLAGQGFVVLRYDKRGAGQSGGRIERVTLRDYADDAVAAVRWLRRRKDVDDRRIIVAGHGDGAAVAMLAARENRIAGMVLMAGMGTTGRELILEQQATALKATTLSEEERAGKVALQQRILDATASGTGWEAIPEELRPMADTPWFRSLVAFDPTEALRRTRQPILILQGALDTQVPPHHAARLAELARARRNTPPVDLREIAGVNHLFVPATTGAAAEYASLPSREISPEVAGAIAQWAAGVARR